MYSNVWSKYLPVIRIILKKSIAEEQVLNLNIPDFERAGMTRKTGYKFHLTLKNGKADQVIVASPVASSLVSVLLQDQVIKQLLKENVFHISLNPKFQLTIKHVPEEMEIQNQEPKTV